MVKQIFINFKTQNILLILLLFFTITTASDYDSTIINISFSGKDTVAIINKNEASLSFAEISSDTIVQLVSFELIPPEVTDNKNRARDEALPEGIYFVKEKITIDDYDRPEIPVALVLNYPNPADQYNNRTGSNVWIQQKTAESTQNESCFYLQTALISELLPFLKINKTPLLIFNGDIKDNSNLQSARYWNNLINNWKQTFASKMLVDHFKMYIVDSDNLNFDYAEKINETITSNPEDYEFEISNRIILQTPNESIASFHLSFIAEDYQIERQFSLSFLPVENEWKIFSENAQYKPPIKLSEEQQIRELVYDWKKYWENQNFPDYIALYAENFSDDRRSYRQYYNYKQETFRSIPEIKVAIDNLTIEPINGNWKATFRQDYWTPSYQDTGMKTLIFSSFNSRFKIIYENWNPLE